MEKCTFGTEMLGKVSHYVMNVDQNDDFQYFVHTIWANVYK